MKTAISIEKELFTKAQKLSTKLQISRSQLFAQALEYLLEKSETLEIIQKLNAVYNLNNNSDNSETNKNSIPTSSKARMKRIVEKW
jgi:metal-responsive CopG/Arc/MetJ family transcriptional regulator